MGKNCPKLVELIQRSIKLLLLHLVGHLYYLPTLMMHGQTQTKFLKSSVAVACFLPGRAKDLSAPL
jgi:hypothetical protein